MVLAGFESTKVRDAATALPFVCVLKVVQIEAVVAAF